MKEKIVKCFRVFLLAIKVVINQKLVKILYKNDKK